MIKLCPYCGFSTGRILVEGITTCNNCSQVFTSSSYYQILSAAWVVRHWYIDDTDYLKQKFGYSDTVLERVKKHVIDEGLCHDELLKVLAEESCLDRPA